MSVQENKAKVHFQKRLGQYLRTKRTTSMLSQRQVADDLGLGTAQFISNIERGECSVPNHVLKYMIKRYAISPKEILLMLTELKMSYFNEALFAGKQKFNAKKTRMM